MATLAAQILTDIQVVVASAHLVDLSNQRDADVSVDTTLLTKVCNYAAAKVQSYLGTSVDGTDLTAVDIGVRWATLLLKGSFSLIGGVNNSDTRDALIAELKEYRAVLVIEASTPVVGIRDNDELNLPYTNDWETEDLD